MNFPEVKTESTTLINYLVIYQEFPDGITVHYPMINRNKHYYRKNKRGIIKRVDY